MNEDTEPVDPGGDRRRLGTDALNETVGEVVDRKTKDKRSERVFVDAFL
jgi:hypothetical protein